MKLLHLLIILLLLIHPGCVDGGKKGTGNESKPVIHVFAAAGTRQISHQICALFEEENGIDIKCSFASSGTLARQISQGAAFDIFISANRQWIDFLSEGAFIQQGSISKIAENSLVLAIPSSKHIKIPEFSRKYPINTSIESRIAIGDPAYVPVGRYAMQVLKALGWDEQLQDKIILAKDVSMALKYAELGECDWAMIYRSEALLSSKAKIISTVPDSLHQPVEFFLSLRTGASDTAHLLAELYSSDTAKQILSSAGFRTKNLSR